MHCAPLVRRLPLRTSMLYLGVGVAIAPPGLRLLDADPLQYSEVPERIAEVAVLIVVHGISVAPPDAGLCQAVESARSAVRSLSRLSAMSDSASASEPILAARRAVHLAHGSWFSATALPGQDATARMPGSVAIPELRSVQDATL